MKSSVLPVNIGVLQGSCSLLFMIFISDIVNSSSELALNLFADDASVNLKNVDLSNLHQN